MRTMRIPRRWVVAVVAIAAAGIGASSPAASAAPAPRPVASAPASPSPGPAKAVRPHLTTNTPAGCNKATAPGVARCFATVRTPSDHTITADAAGPPATALGAPDIQAAYNLPSATAGSGRTVAIVDAGDDPTAESDLAVFRSQYGLPPCTTANGCFTKVNQDGQQGSYPPVAGTWPLEESLDLDAVSSACPNCHILLVEATSATIENLGTAENTAAASGAVAVSNSYGTDDQAAETDWDDQYYNHPGVVVTSSAGDSGYGVNYPSGSRYVTAVGGTSLKKDTTTARGWTESVWGSAGGGEGTGSGCSAFEAQQPWQAAFTPDCTNRATADVSAVADPATGLAVYDTTGQSGWLQVGGTSLSSPLVAATYALAGAPAAGTYPSSYLYAHYLGDSSPFNDVTSGADGNCGNELCTAGSGWDGPTGLGTPNGVTGFAYAQLGSITGKVTDAATGRPVAGAEVSAGRLKVSTGADGGYTLAGLPAGGYPVAVSDYGYESQTATVTVTAGQSAGQDFQLVATARETVSGKVTADAWPLYAQVSWSDGDGHQGTTFTDPATGAYSLNLLDNSDYTLTVTPKYPGYETPAAKTVSVKTGDVGQDFAVEVDPLACTALGYRATDTGTTQGFDQGSLPTGWTVTNVDRGYPGYSGKPGWAFDNPGKRANDTGGTGNFAIVDSDFYGAHHYQDTYLTSPAIDMSADKNPVVRFASDLVPTNNTTAAVEYSTDGGKTWDKVWAITGLPGDPGPATRLFGLPKAAGKSGVRVRFGYQGSWSQYWELDNVFLGERTCTQQPGGLLVGRVTDSDGTAVNGATVSSVADPSEHAVTVATPGDTVVDGGLYALFVSQTGSQQFTASASGHQSATKSATVTTGAVGTLNFTLDPSTGSDNRAGTNGEPKRR